MANYDYLPLKSSQIRLIKIDINDDDELLASIEHADLDPEDPITYSTLSYVWGDACQKVHLPCDGKAFISITTTLHEALRQVAKFNPNKLLWVDQICINQSDIPERSEQVKLMNTIYEKAETVIAWLGSATTSTPKAVDLISRVANVAMPTLTDMFRMEEYPDDWVGLEKYEEIPAEESTKLGISFDDEEAWDAFADFFDRPWFQRIWIVQEILPARKAIMLCGTHSLEWKVLQAAARWYHYKAAAIASRHERRVNGVDLTVAMNVPWVFRHGSEFHPQLLGQKTRAVFKWPLRRLLEQFRPRLATEAKDKVYALLGVSDLGISHSSKIVDFTIDYSQELKEVFALVTKAMISNGDVNQDDLDVIMTARRHNEEPGWPTWVPDWRMENGSGCEWGVGQPLPTNRENARQHPNGRCQAFDTGNPYTLGVEGVTLGRVTYASQHYHLTPMLLEGGLAECHDACVSTLFSYPTGEDLEEAFALTFMAGELPDDITKSGTSLKTYTNNYLEWARVLILPLTTEEQRRARLEEAQPLLKLGFRNDWAQRLLAAYCERRFYMTDTRYMGLGNHHMTEGDLVVVLFGLRVPCVLRPRGKTLEDGYEFIGEAYCHGMMAGEALDNLERMEGRVVSGSQRFILH
ncbi:heterokaryon incompatibility protein-domain-containing protein [Dactylonectria estremocensis]|uniref:Heterokaryon incompatibility protein-domain-containing protein n=1 Tax=Dactylonectria estremocensis TaxID=1079267 RepID=A0A9P9FD02_9HYPO|nr:heterokaryon incompatibility protein-domain-containing protein [Dactylonectria estremocensis]